MKRSHLRFNLDNVDNGGYLLTAPFGEDGAQEKHYFETKSEVYTKIDSEISNKNMAESIKNDFKDSGSA